MKMTVNQKNALWLACLSFAAAVGVALFVVERIESLFSLFTLIFISIPLIGAIGIFKKNKEVLITSAIISLLLSLIGIMSVGGLFMASSLILIISSFIYLMETEKAEVAEKIKRAAQLAAFAALIAGIGIAVSDSSWLYGAMSVPLVFFEIISIYALLVILPLLGLVGIRLGKKDFLSTSAAVSSALMIYFVLLLQKPLYLIHPMLLILSAFIYRSGIEKEIKKEIVDVKLKKIALLLAIVSLFAALITTLYSERVLVINGCYTYQTSPTSGDTICNDFRPDYMIPAILSTIGIAGILRGNKIMLYASTSVSFVRMVVYYHLLGFYSYHHLF